MKKKYIYMWFDGDIKRHYFSSKLMLNRWIKDFVNEAACNPDFFKWDYPNLKGKQPKEIIKYFNSSLFVEKLELDI